MRYRGPRNVARVLRSLEWLPLLRLPPLPRLPPLSRLLPLSALLALLGGLAAPAAFACNADGEHAGPSRADEAGPILSAGVIDFGKDFETVEVGVEHRFGADWCHGMGPHVGAFVTPDESFFLYAGTDQRFNFGRAWFVDLVTSVGFYEEGDGKDIGGELEFRSGLSVGRRLRGGSRVSFGFFHLSNSSYYRRNPGVNSLLLRWSR